MKEKTQTYLNVVLLVVVFKMRMYVSQDPLRVVLRTSKWGKVVTEPQISENTEFILLENQIPNKE